ncbi:MAG: hypothetical protein PF569_09550 [Candidatus Woesearchaeota archaeon]|jgi:hypothetical protein|nr:hypothetical protein [Candidatus Woesearchaeota archaeon]
MDDYGDYCSYNLSLVDNGITIYNYYVQYEVDLANYNLDNRTFTYYPRIISGNSVFPSISIFGLVSSLFVILLFM